MILSHLADAASVKATLPSLFALAFDFLESNDLRALEPSTIAIDGDDVFAIVAKDLGRGKSDSPLEYHRRYADIQCVISGVDVIGWRSLSSCKRPREPFDETRDLGFFHDQPVTWLNVPEHHFAVFFPNDAHAPLANTGPIHKVVMKVRCER